MIRKWSFSDHFEHNVPKMIIFGTKIIFINFTEFLVKINFTEFSEIFTEFNNLVSIWINESSLRFKRSQIETEKLTTSRFKKQYEKSNRNIQTIPS